MRKDKGIVNGGRRVIKRSMIEMRGEKERRRRWNDRRNKDKDNERMNIVNMGDFISPPPPPPPFFFKKSHWINHREGYGWDMERGI